MYTIMKQVEAKDLILEYIDGLPKNEKAEGLTILRNLKGRTGST